MINEKELKKAMKAAYRTTGYHVAQLCMNNQELLSVQSNQWIVVTKRSTFPREALGLLAEHLGFLPEQEAYLMMKGEDPQMEMLDNAALEIAQRYNERISGEAQRTPITIAGKIIYQVETSRELLPVEAATLTLLDAEAEDYTCWGTERCLRYETDAQLLLLARTNLDRHAKLLKQLEEIQLREET